MIVKISNSKSIFENEDIKWFLMDGQIWISKYGDYSQIESKIGEFIGSFNWLYEENDTMLFDKEYGRLQIAIIDLVGKIDIDHSQENKKIAESKKDADLYISEKTNQKFEFPNQVLYSEVSDWLYSIEKEQYNQDSLMVAITEDFIFYVVNNQLKAVHGFVDQRDTFENIVSTVGSFLKAHNSEFIIMSIKEEADAKKSTISFDAAVKKYQKSYWSDITDITSTTLGELRGKLVILSRYANSTIGIPAYNGWADNATFDLPNGIHVQDEYKLKETDIKIEAIKTCFNASSSSLKINFLSGYIDGGFPPSYAPSVANTVNPWIKDNLKNYDNRGIVIYDFVTSELMKGWFK